jgi:hypothetical protein
MLHQQQFVHRKVVYSPPYKLGVSLGSMKQEEKIKEGGTFQRGGFITMYDCFSKDWID